MSTLKERLCAAPQSAAILLGFVGLGIAVVGFRSAWEWRGKPRPFPMTALGV